MKLSPVRFLLLAMGVYVLVMYPFCLWRHFSSALGDADNAVFDQSCWTTLQYHQLMVNGVEGGTHFAVHNSPIFLLLLPFYWLQPGVPILLLLQTLALAIGAIPVYLLGIRMLPERTARWMVICYLCYHPLHGVNYDQVNESAYATAPLLFALYALSREKWRWYWICCVLALMVKEDEAFVVALLGLYTVWSGVRSRWAIRKGDIRSRAALDLDPWNCLGHGGLMFLAALGYALFSFGWVLPHFQAETGFTYFIAERYGALGRTLPEVLHTMVTKPGMVLGMLGRWDRIWYVPDLLAPFAFMSLATPTLLLVSVPSMAINLLSSFEMMHNSASRYPAPIIPFVVASAIATLSRMDEKHQSKWVKACIGLTLGFSLLATPSPPRLGFHLPWIDAHQRLLLRAAHALPEEWSLSTQTDILQHACHRRHAWIGFRDGVDAILVDKTPHNRKSGEVNNWFQQAGFEQSLQVALKSGQYHLTWEQDGVQLFTRVGVPFAGSL